ncbi:MAG TPA: DUF4249 domain-containing protein [Cyclobacteriaceae bacterium]
MKIRIVTLFIFLITVLIITCCIDPFNPPSTKEDISLLVVDGFLNATDGSCTIKLSRTIPISVDSAIRVEKRANVQLLDDHDNAYSLTESAAGTYSISGLTLNTAYKYKLKIVTQKNIEYQSDLVSINKTPAIDSVSWGYERTGVPIYVNTHDPENNTHFYSWTFTETWAYTSAYATNLKVEGDSVVYSTVDLFHCWKNSNSTSILISSSTSLKEDVISEFTINTIPWSSNKLSIKYSVLVEQHALSKEAFDYAQLVKKNTENLGSLFDPLPSGITGNIHCITNPDETPIGFFTACTVEKKRIFITDKDIRSHRPSNIAVITGYEGCELDSIKLGDPIIGIPVAQIYKGPFLVGYLAAPESCVDCIYLGGFRTKPDFWE